MVFGFLTIWLVCVHLHKKKNVQIYSTVLGLAISILEKDMLNHCLSFQSTRKILDVLTKIGAKIGQAIRQGKGFGKIRP